MKKAVLLTPFLMMSCNKKEAVDENSSSDSIVIYEQTEAEDSDSSGNGVVTVGEVGTPEISNVFRATDGNKIIKTINGDMIPLTVSDEFTEQYQQYILKIKNCRKKEISGKINPQNPEMNIRFNQIKLANGAYDGPFGREFSYDIKEGGEIWLIIGKSNMASGQTNGKFEIEIK